MRRRLAACRPRRQRRPLSYLDVNGDGDVTPLDMMMVLNHINGRTRASAEGEASLPVMARQPSVSLAGLHHAERDGYVAEAEGGFTLEDILSDIASDVSRG